MNKGKKNIIIILFFIPIILLIIIAIDSHIYVKYDVNYQHKIGMLHNKIVKRYYKLSSTKGFHLDELKLLYNKQLVHLNKYNKNYAQKEQVFNRIVDKLNEREEYEEIYKLTMLFLDKDEKNLDVINILGNTLVQMKCDSTKIEHFLEYAYKYKYHPLIKNNYNLLSEKVNKMYKKNYTNTLKEAIIPQIYLKVYYKFINGDFIEENSITNISYISSLTRFKINIKAPADSIVGLRLDIDNDGQLTCIDSVSIKFRNISFTPSNINDFCKINNSLKLCGIDGYFVFDNISYSIKKNENIEFLLKFNSENCYD